MIAAIRAFISRLPIAAFRDDRRGATAIEYGLMVALISVAIIGAVTTTGGNLKTTFSTISSALANK